MVRDTELAEAMVVLGATGVQPGDDGIQLVMAARIGELVAAQGETRIVIIAQ